MRFRRSGRPAHSRSSKAARSPGSAMAMTAANRSSSFIGLVLRLTQRNRRAKGAVAVERILYSFSENSEFRHPGDTLEKWGSRRMWATGSTAGPRCTPAC